MAIDKAYDAWSGQYDSNQNKTRDLEKIVAQATLKSLKYRKVLILGCGTGKNMEWIAKKADSVLGLDFSTDMMAKAKAKVNAPNVDFRQADLNQNWGLKTASVDLITCSLVLEHIQNLSAIFAKARQVLAAEGQFYICELHPFKQYSGTKARYETDAGTVELEVYIHHMSEFVNAAQQNGFALKQVREWWDNDSENRPPRLLSFVFKKLKVVLEGE